MFGIGQADQTVPTQQHDLDRSLSGLEGVSRQGSDLSGVLKISIRRQTLI